jgi:hypothetical protein
MEGLSSLFGLDMNPIFRIPTQTNRALAESHQLQFHQQPELRSRGTPRAARLRADAQSDLRDAGVQHQLRPEHGHRLGTSPYVWSTGISVQQELLSGVALTVGYYRNSWGNLSMVGQHPHGALRLHAVQHQAPLDPRLPGGGGNTVRASST